MGDEWRARPGSGNGRRDIGGPRVAIAAGELEGCATEGCLLFSGVPFAEPPVGPLRLRPPHPVPPWSGVRRAVDFPPRPPQLDDVRVGEGAAKMSEDCLYLNIWTPALDGELRPVLVWIYGGGFETGSASPPEFAGDEFARRGGVVVVAANYRVGALGFLYLADLDPRWAGSANLGLLDQIAALSWVQENVAAFGGDPENVTVVGQSAGAASIAALLAIPAASWLFHRAILQSGPVERICDRWTASAIARHVLDGLGLAEAEELVRVPVGAILGAQESAVDRDIGVRGLPGGRFFGPVLDGEVLARRPQEVLAAGERCDVGLLVGATRDETESWRRTTRRYDPVDGDALRREVGRALGDDALAGELLEEYRAEGAGADPGALRTRFLTDFIYRIPGVRLAEAQRSGGGRAYSYRFDYADGTTAPWHCADIRVLMRQFSGDGPLPVPETPRSRDLSDEMMDAFVSFAATGSPGWPVYESEEPTTRVFGGTETLVREPEAALRTLWDQVSFC